MNFDSLSVLAIHLTESRSVDGFSKLGGFPDLPEDLQWPVRDGVPLAFLAQISLSEFRIPPTLHGLPAAGYLFFFYEAEQNTWGFDPADRGSWRVLFSEKPPVESSEELPEGLEEDYVFAEKRVQFRPFSSLPDTERLDESEERTEEYLEALVDAKQESYDGFPHHQIGGFPDVIQSDEMELQCQLVSNGLYCGDSSGYNDPRAETLAPGAKHWRLLFQLDSDEETGMMWGDSGMLYFWIREQDLESKSFENVWMILQCT